LKHSAQHSNRHPARSGQSHAELRASHIAERDDDTDDLVRSAARGQRAAQRELLHRLASPLHDTLYQIFGSNEQMEGLLEHAFIEVFRSLPAYDDELGLDTWASAIAVRFAHRQLESERRHPREGTSRVLPCAAASSAGEAPSAGTRPLYEFLRRLEPEQHITLALAMMGSRPLAHVARLTRVSPLVALARLLRARRALRAAARDDRRLGASIARHSDSR
jgi:DNA-directed RNA polymerase specialized sigma24 family protein